MLGINNSFLMSYIPFFDAINLLNKRQRMDISRNSCSENDKKNRQSKLISPSQITDKEILIDGFNLLITLESALSGGFIFVGKDGCFRDLSGVHGSYKRVEATQKAIELVGHFLDSLKVEKVVWYFDQPVSNSGRLKTMLYEIATLHSWNWQIELDFNPDKILMESQSIIVSTDALILNHCQQWLNLARLIITSSIPNAHIISLEK